MQTLTILYFTFAVFSVKLNIIYSITIHNLFFQGIENNFYRLSSSNSGPWTLLERAEQVSLKYCSQLEINDLIIQSVDECFYKTSGMVSFIEVIFSSSSQVLTNNC